jgi:uncharacterized membrane protein
MITKNDIKNVIIVFIILFVIDFIYLYINQDWYKNETYRSQKSELKLKWIGVIFRYIAQSLGLYIFILRNKLNLSYSFLYGIIIYGNYLSTNYATINIFDEKLALADLSKGGIIMIITSYLYYKFKNYQ